METLQILTKRENKSRVLNTENLGLEEFCKQVVESYYPEENFPSDSLKREKITNIGVEYLSRISNNPKEIRSLQKDVKELMKKLSKKGFPVLNEVTFHSTYERNNDRDTEMYRNVLFTFIDLRKALLYLEPKTKGELERKALVATNTLYRLLNKPINVQHYFKTTFFKPNRSGDDVIVEINTKTTSKNNNSILPYEGYIKVEVSSDGYISCDYNTLDFNKAILKVLLNACETEDIQNGEKKIFNINLKLESHKGESIVAFSINNEKEKYIIREENEYGYTVFNVSSESKKMTDESVQQLFGNYPSGYYNPVVLQSKKLIGHIRDFVHEFYYDEKIFLFLVALANWFVKKKHTFPKIQESQNTIFSGEKVFSPLFVSQNLENITPNDINISDTNLGMVITGRNAGGKTSYINTIGLSLILAQNGFPVLSESEVIVSPFGDISTHYIEPNEISTGRSRYVAELHRIKYLLSNMQKNSLLLMDEPFTGTGSKDATKKLKDILTVLGENNIKTLCTTHLPNIIRFVEKNGKYKNTHVNEQYAIEEGGDFSSHGGQIAKLEGVSLKDMRKLFSKNSKKN